MMFYRMGRIDSSENNFEFNRAFLLDVDVFLSFILSKHFSYYIIIIASQNDVIILIMIVNTVSKGEQYVLNI